MTLSSNLDDINKTLNTAYLTQNVSFGSLDVVTTVMNVACSIHNLYVGSLLGHIERKLLIQRGHGVGELLELWSAFE